MKQLKTYVIYNDRAGGGSARKYKSRIIGEIRLRFGKKVIFITPQDIITDTAVISELKNEAGLVIIAGGDGTIHHTVNTLINRGFLESPFPQLGIINLGTGCGLANSLNLPETVEQQLDLIAQNNSVNIDLGLISCYDISGEPVKRCFISECQIGIGSAVSQRVGGFHKFLGGKAGFGLAAITEILKFKTHKISVAIDEKVVFQDSTLGLAIGNGRYCGGGMMLTPHANLCDNLLDILIIGELSLVDRIKTFPLIYKGGHIGRPGLHYYQAIKINITGEEPLHISADGEPLGSTPCEIRLLPSVLPIIGNL